MGYLFVYAIRHYDNDIHHRSGPVELVMDSWLRHVFYFYTFLVRQPPD